MIGSKPDQSLFESVRVYGSESLILDCIKRGEDDEDVSCGELAQREGQSVILRIYESIGGKSRGTIETSLPVKKIIKCNVLETMARSAGRMGILSVTLN